VTKIGYKAYIERVPMPARDTTLIVNLAEEGSSNDSESYFKDSISNTTDTVSTTDDNSQVKWNFYPDPRKTLVRENEEIVFELFPPNQEDFTLHFGDGNSVTIPSSKIDCSSRCVTFYQYKYPQSGVYKVSTSHEDKTLQKDNNKLFIVKKSTRTDEELEGLAKEEFLKAIKAGLESKKILPCNVDSSCNSKLAIAVLHDANFKHDDEPMVRSVTQHLVNAGYWVVERHPQVLIKLVFESVVDTSKDNKTTGYLDTLEYTLVPSHQEKQPFIYNAKIETEAQLREQITNEILAAQEEDISEGEIKGKQNDGRKRSVNISRSRSSFFAKVNTANYLLVLDTKNLKVQNDKDKDKKYYSLHYQNLTKKRTVSMEMNVRLISRGGNIIWMEDVKGVFKDSEETIMPSLPLKPKVIPTMSPSYRQPNLRRRTWSSRFPPGEG